MTSPTQPIRRDVLRYAAFTRDGRGGNPAGVVISAHRIERAEMQAIATAVGYSETAFLVESPTAGTYDTRYFSPVAEVDFCGHATVAAAVAVGERTGIESLVLRTKIGAVTVQTAPSPAGLVATLTSVPTQTRPAITAERRQALAALRLNETDLDPSYPMHVAFAGNDHLLVPVASRRILAALDYDYAALEHLMRNERWTTVDVFWAERPTLFHARNAFPPGGVVEDPATGAAAAALGGYLRDLGLAPVPGDVLVVQGVDMGAPSELLIHLEPDLRTVEVSGTAAPIGAPDEAARRLSQATVPHPRGESDSDE